MGNQRNVSAIWLLGVIFSLLGSIFLVLGAALLYGLRDTPAWMVGVIFAGIGGLFLILGIVFLSTDRAHRRRLRDLLEGGRYVWGEIVSLEPNTMLRINNRNPYFAHVRYTDGLGREFYFQSESSLSLWWRDELIGSRVKVYIRDNTYADYYVDISSIHS